jgi:Protein of unknown function (DUF2726)
MFPASPWSIAIAAAAVVALAALWWLRRPRRQSPMPLPTEWNVNARPVFSADERRIYRQLREALPHHVVLSKLPLVRFCQPNDPQQVRYWYELLGSIHVTFAVCSANGRVLAAIDLENDRANSRRVLQIKQSVLGACRVRYMRCPVDQLPSIPELQLLVPHAVAASRGPQPAPTVSQARDHLATTVASRRRERTALWQDSGLFQDSFFMPDVRVEGSSSEFAGLASGPGSLYGDLDGPPTEPGGGRVVDAPRSPTRH